VIYTNGQEIRLWDRVEAWRGSLGIVVLSVDTGEYSPEFPESDWKHLNSGVMIDTEGGGLIYYDSLDAELRLISRGGPPTVEEWAALKSEQERRRAQGTND
jgi:hypothetical protein